MSDMARRPRGGWQVGHRRFGQERPVADVDDPAPDVYTVARQGHQFIVRHYPSAVATTPCCVVTAAAKPGQSDVDVLAAVSRHCDRKHQREAQRDDA